MWTRRVQNTFAAALFLFAAAGSACVETAECDATVACDSGRICYDYECRATCELDEQCGSGSVCAPCQQDDASGTVDHCFESTLFACVAEVVE